MMKTKQQIHDLIVSGRCREVFTHSICGSFDITAMREAAARGEYMAFTGPLDDTLIAMVMKTRDWDKDRVRAIATDILSLLDPSIWIEDKNKQHVLIDGTHRLIALRAHGLSKFPGFIARMDQIIRPDMSQLYSNPDHDWGRIEVRDGALYDRETGEKIP